MARTDTEKARVTRHMERIQSANKVYDRWAAKYRCDTLQEYYCGDQHPGYLAPDHYAQGYRPYTANMIFPAVQTQLPSLLFYRPQVKIEPKPPYGDDPVSTIAERAKLCEDTIQTFIEDPQVAFDQHTNLALLDAQFRFGIVEVGYTADWIDNPHAGKPVLKDKAREDDPDEPMTDGAGEPVRQADRIPENEQLFVRRIDPRTWRVSLSGKNVTEENDWVGYYEWHYVEDVKRNKKYKHTATLKASGQEKDAPATSRDLDAEQHRGMVKLWKLWDLRTKTRCVLADGHEKYLLEGEAWTYLPFAALKFNEIPSEWYPLPPIANWLGPQDTINEVRESRRIHRKRFYRRYTLRNGAMDDPEIEKLETGGDGIIVKHNGQPNEQVLQPVLDAALGPDTDKDILEAKEDFQTVSGNVDEQGVGQSDTATQANIVDVRSRIRESASRVEVAKWLGRICRLMLLTIRDKMQLEFWVKRNADAIAQDPQEIMRIVGTYQQITAADLGDGALDVSVDVTSLSPVSEGERGQQWMQMLALITNPAIAMMLAMSEPMLRKTLKYHGITSQGDIAEIRKVLEQTLMMQSAAQGQLGAGGQAEMPGQPAGQPAGIPAAGVN